MNNLLNNVIKPNNIEKLYYEILRIIEGLYKFARHWRIISIGFSHINPFRTRLKNKEKKSTINNGNTNKRTGAHIQYDIQCHIVWITKYRKKILYGKIADRLKVLLMQGCSAKEIVIIKEKVMPDHGKYTSILINGTGNAIFKG